MFIQAHMYTNTYMVSQAVIKCHEGTVKKDLEAGVWEGLLS